MAERVADTLAQRIIIGDLKPGTRLRQELYAHEFNTSHVPIREAFLRLETRKLVVSEPRRGVRVAPISSGDDREIARMRGALEVMGLRTLSGKLTARQLGKVREALLAGEAATDLVSWEASNRAFHVALAELSLMPRLVEVVRDLNIAFSRNVLQNSDKDSWKPAFNNDHHRIYECLVAADYAMAASLLEGHIWHHERVNKR
ncbi:GntR family transcriptional regulator [Brevundimonas sp.]|uniref:GntR family transcriptional regulator n=1 Tax=Brevundimonas sp. TaxID=1871086 RepID=UPI002FC74181